MHLVKLVSLLFVSLLIGGSAPEKPIPAVQSTPVNPFIVVLDAGHGGHDPGNLGNGYLEKKIALNIVLQAGAILEKQPNIKVIYTRKDDTFVDLYKRGEIANKANANLFVSVHCDSHTSNAYGAGTFVMGLHVNQKNFEVAKKENSVIYLEDNYKERYAQYDINSPESLIGHTIMQEEFLEESYSGGQRNSRAVYRATQAEGSQSKTSRLHRLAPDLYAQCTGRNRIFDQQDRRGLPQLEKGATANGSGNRAGCDQLQKASGQGRRRQRSSGQFRGQHTRTS